MSEHIQNNFKQKYDSNQLNLPSLANPLNKGLIRKKRDGRMIYHDDDADDQITKNKLNTINFQHQDLDEVQHQCNCRRHTFKMKILKPDLTKSTHYRQSFIPSKPIPNIINKSVEYNHSKSPHIGLDSIYSKNYSSTQPDKLQRPKPEDLLKTGGPSPFLTSYSSGFPGHRTINQYVKPNNNVLRGYFPLANNKSTYSKQFGDRSCPKQIKGKIPDNLKFSQVWTGETSYKNKFIQPNPEHYARATKNPQKFEKSLEYKHQYETTYKKSFLLQEPATCPAKQKLQLKLKGIFNNSKDRFAENSDFKSLSPDYHAISTSKHSYV